MDPAVLHRMGAAPLSHGRICSEFPAIQRMLHYSTARCFSLFATKTRSFFVHIVHYVTICPYSVDLVAGEDLNLRPPGYESIKWDS